MNFLPEYKFSKLPKPTTLPFFPPKSTVPVLRFPHKPKKQPHSTNKPAAHTPTFPSVNFGTKIKLSRPFESRQFRGTVGGAARTGALSPFPRETRAGPYLRDINFGKKAKKLAAGSAGAFATLRRRESSSRTSHALPAAKY